MFKSENLKNWAIIILVLAVLAVGVRGYFLWQDNKDAESEKALNRAKIARLTKNIINLLDGVKERDKTIAERDIIIAKAIADKNQIEKDFEDYKNDLKKKSQAERDQILTDSLRNHEVEVKILAENNYMQVIPQERNDLLDFVIDYDKLFILHDKNEKVIIPNLLVSNGLLKLNEISLKQALADTNKKCGLEKTNMQLDIDKYKKDAFWSKVGAVVAILLAVLIVK